MFVHMFSTLCTPECTTWCILSIYSCILWICFHYCSRHGIRKILLSGVAEPDKAGFLAAIVEVVSLTEFPLSRGRLSPLDPAVCCLSLINSVIELVSFLSCCLSVICTTCAQEIHEGKVAFYSFCFKIDMCALYWCLWIMSKSNQRPLFVQKLITSYFPPRETYSELLSVSTTRVGSFCSNWTSDSGYVSETPVSKQGKREFYLGQCNTIEESPRRALFMTALSTDSYSYPTTSFEYTPSLSDVRTSIGSPTGSCESIAFRKCRKLSE